jgi:hypothetical protein
MGRHSPTAPTHRDHRDIMPVHDPVDPTESDSSGSVGWMPLCVPGRKHPAEIVLRALTA